MDVRGRALRAAHQHAGHRHLAVLLQRRHRRSSSTPTAAARSSSTSCAAGGGGERRISFGEGRYATPVWSPRGDCIAFTKITGGSFGIGVMRPDGSGERMLANGFLVEGPTWAPNGRVLMFFRQQPNSGGRAGLGHAHQIDITGRFERQVPTPTDASDPAWSPLIPQ